MKFPIEKLLNDPNVKEVEGHLQYDNVEGKTEVLTLDYWVYTSVSDAEESVVEYLCTQNLYILHDIDLNIEWEIGDNSWYYIGEYVPIIFIRNNVRIIVSAYCDWCSFDSDVILEFAKKVDDLLIDTEKVEDVKLIPAPVINSIEIVSGEPKIGEPSTFNIDAFDPNGQQLKYRFLGRAPSHVTDNGVKRNMLPSWILNGETTTNIIKIWVYNEDHIVASAEYFLETSAAVNEGTTAGHPQAFTLFQNLPNPFNQATSISYELRRAGRVSLRIYDLLGSEVTTLEDGHREPGRYQVFWDGKDSKGNPVSSGIYLYRLKVGSKEETKRMTLVR